MPRKTGELAPDEGPFICASRGLGCLTYGIPPTDDVKKPRYAARSPLPFAPDPRRSWALAAIRGYWWPLKRLHHGWGNTGIEAVLNWSHEVWHLGLLNTELGHNLLLLSQFEFIALVQALLDGTPVLVPSLHERTGMLKTAHRAIALAAPEVSLLQELFAAALVRSLADHHIVAVTKW